MANTPLIQLVKNSEICQFVKFSEQFSEVQVRKVKLNICFSSGNSELLTIISLYNPQNGLFWWDYRESYNWKWREDNTIDALLKGWFIHISDDMIVCFRLRKFKILFRFSCEHDDIFDESYKSVISKLRMHIEEIEKIGFLFRLTKWYSKIDLNKHMPHALIKFCDPWGMLSKPKINMKITRQNAQWYIELIFVSPSSQKYQISQPEHFLKNNYKKATLILNNNFEVIDVIVENEC